MIGATAASAQTTISSMSDFNNNTTYTIKSVNRGFLFYDANISATDIVSSSRNGSTSNVSPSGNINATGEQFAFLRTNNTPAGKCYLYSVGAGKFVCRGTSTTNANANNLTLTDQVSANCLVSFEPSYEEGATQKVLVLYEGGNKYVINITAYTSYNGIRVASYANTVGDDGNRMTITAVNTNASSQLASALEKIMRLEPASASDIADAREKLAKAGKVGYPSTTSSVYTALKNCLDGGSPSSYDLSTALTNYYNYTDVVLPEDGKAYTFTFKHMDGTRTYLYWNGSKVTSDVLGSGQGLPETAKFICRKVTVSGSTKYMFVNNAGKYLVWWGGHTNTNANADNAYESNNGFTSAYDSGKNLFQIIKFTNSGNDHVECTNEDLLGCVGLKGKRSGSDPESYFILKNTAGDAVASSLLFVDKTTTDADYRTCAVMIEEATYPNNVTLNGTDLTDESGNSLRLATFSAPFPTILPEGVTAYYASSYAGGTVTLREAASTAGDYLPANEGFILATIDAEKGSVMMVPAASETAVTTISGNKLGHSAGADKDLSTLGSEVTPFILTAVERHVAFYALNDSDVTLGMNKAYLALPSTGTLQTVKMDFGHTTTGITDATANDLLTGKTYDLSGRVVKDCSKAGIYIRNGRKFIVK